MKHPYSYLVMPFLLLAACSELDFGQVGVEPSGREAGSRSAKVIAGLDPSDFLLEAEPQGRLDRLRAEHPDAPGFALTVIHRGQLVSAATGQADSASRVMTAASPLRRLGLINI